MNATIGAAARLPITLLVAPSGSGKTIALRHFVESLTEPVLHFDVQVTHTTLTRFVRGLATALGQTLPTIPQSLAIAHERATQSARPADVLAAWLAQHLRDLERTLVIDSYHYCEADSAIDAFLAGAIDRTRPRIRWIVATRSTGGLPFAKWFARGDADVPITEATLALTGTQVSDLAAQFDPLLDPHILKRLSDSTNGSIGRLLFALKTTARDPALAQRFVRAGTNVSEFCVDEALAALEPDERSFLIETVMFADLGPQMLTASGRADAGAMAAAVRAKLPHAVEERAGVVRYTDFFTESLRRRLTASDADALVDAHARVGRALERCDRIVDALGHYIAAREVRSISRLVESRGLALVEAGYGDVIQEAIDVLDPIARAGSPVILAIRATFESRLGRFDSAESYFALALDRAPDTVVRNEIAYGYATHLLRFKRPEAIVHLEALVNHTTASDELQCYGRSALGPAYVFARRYDDALRSVTVALQLSRDAPSHHLRARVFHQAAFVALYRDDGERAKQLAEQSLRIAQDHGYFDIAAAALTVLYNVASDLEDDPLQSLRFLDDVAECAAKSGSLTNHFLALVAKLEIQVERGDEEAIEELDAKLRTSDARFCGSAAYEALIASQALRAGWNGDYGGAYGLLVSSTEQQWSPERKALRWAEVAVYAAAAGLGSEAACALRSSLELLAVCEPGYRIVRTRLFLALAMILCGRSESAHAMLALVDTDPRAASPRLCALKRAFTALWDRYRGVRNQAALLDAFERLEDVHFGGVARLILNFPLADNASLRLADLSLPDRRVLAKLARGDTIVTEQQGRQILTVLGCVDLRAAMRSVVRYESAAGAAAHDGTAR